MYEFHGWFGIAESAEETDGGTLAEGTSELRSAVRAIQWSTGRAELASYNGQYFVTLNGLVNRRRDEADEMVRLMGFISARFPGSWGLVYERSDDLNDPAGGNHFRVHVMSRGAVNVRMDPFLSPCVPVIED